MVLNISRHFILCALPIVVNAFTKNIDPSHPPHKSESGQSGYNDCGTKDSPSSQCQNAWINGLDDFCLFSAPTRTDVGNSERVAVAYCTQPGHGSRLMPAGTLQTAHFVQTPHYVQITGKGDFTKTMLTPKDEGGELDPHGADGLGNPIGGLVFGKDSRGQTIQFAEWTEFIGADEFCIRACFPTADGRASAYCNHIYDTQGCYWNMPGNYENGFDSCKADDVEPMGEYKYKGNDGQYTTYHWYQGQPNRPGPHPAARTFQCTNYASAAINPGANYGRTQQAARSMSLKSRQTLMKDLNASRILAQHKLRSKTRRSSI
ncbi:hypothetical protein CROQUDRAFT_688327 [Cronartium quercuum f. sp. fusiforme G11]|uniref:Uncharacterized protein n=1 Tax=Cronartium quercuum f. sp. fusiforme G11 TaxID=708437 RepID=A0A9P6N7P3_9BASI|nr:hypothetical protein CROQUDRAFT_688327 [Cronartium quercuum f. sp. fusiforme G11]